MTRDLRVAVHYELLRREATEAMLDGRIQPAEYRAILDRVKRLLTLNQRRLARIVRTHQRTGATR